MECKIYSIGSRRIMTTVSIWLVLLALTINVLSTQRFIGFTLALKDSKSFLDKNHRHRCCCTDECTSPRTSTKLNSVLFRLRSSRGGSSNRNSDDHDESIRNQRIQSTHSMTNASSRNRAGSLPQLLSTKHGRRTACSLYIWNAPSALLHRWCHHLQRDNIYEGLGGKKVSALYRN